MEFQDVVRKRKMVRNFEDRPIDPAVLDRIIANAQRAPSAGFSQGWAFLVLEGKEETERYWSTTMSPERRKDFGWPGLFNAPVLIACLSHKQAYLDRYAEADKGWTDRDEKRWPVPYWDIDTGMAALMILLTAVDQGLGACFFGAPPEAHEDVFEAFDIRHDRNLVGVVSLGYPMPSSTSDSLKRGLRGLEQVAHFGRFGLHGPEGMVQNGRTN